MNLLCCTPVTCICFGSSWNRVGEFCGRRPDKTVHCVGILHYGWGWNLASMVDVTNSEAKPAALGYVFVPWFSTGTNSARDFGDPKARVIALNRRSKKRLVAVAVASRWGGTTARSAVCAIFRAATRGYFWNWRCGGSSATVVAR